MAGFYVRGKRFGDTVVIGVPNGTNNFFVGITGLLRGHEYRRDVILIKMLMWWEMRIFAGTLC
jgi:hypothetical protein